MKVTTLPKLKKKSEKVAILTAYDASFARVLTEQGVDAVLVGDSLAMTIMGHKNTLNVSMRQMLHHTQSVAEGIAQGIGTEQKNKPLLIADMPWGSYTHPDKALKNAISFVRAGADMVKLEGAAKNELRSIKLIRSNGIPVCAHLGLTPQSTMILGGFVAQGNTEDSAKTIFNQALALDKLSVEMMVLECIPSDLAEKITRSIKTTTIGIGTFSPCDGQVLVLYDLLGISGR